jgi:hypothetical protein
MNTSVKNKIIAAFITLVVASGLIYLMFSHIRKTIENFEEETQAATGVSISNSPTTTVDTIVTKLDAISKNFENVINRMEVVLSGYRNKSSEESTDLIIQEDDVVISVENEVDDLTIPDPPLDDTLPMEDDSAENVTENFTDYGRTDLKDGVQGYDVGRQFEMYASWKN